MKAIFLVCAGLVIASPTLAASEEHPRSWRDAVLKAEASLPPCEGLDFISKTMLTPPPADCPLTQKAYKHYLPLQEGLRRNCREASAWGAELIKGAKLGCVSESPKKIEARSKRHQKFLRQSLRAYPCNGSRPIKEKKCPDKILEILGDAVSPDHEITSATQGEWARSECRLAAEGLLKLRRFQSNMEKSHFGILLACLDDLCDPEANPGDYLNYLKGGEDAMKGSK